MNNRDLALLASIGTNLAISFALYRAGLLHLIDSIWLQLVLYGGTYLLYEWLFGKMRVKV